MFSLKNIWGVYFVKYFEVKNCIFGKFEVNKCRKPAVLVPSLNIPGGFEGLFAFFDSLHHHSLAGHSPLPIVGSSSSS
jgi:hypothetical protein